MPVLAVAMIRSARSTCAEVLLAAPPFSESRMAAEARSGEKRHASHGPRNDMCRLADCSSGGGLYALMGRLAGIAPQCFHDVELRNEE